MISFWRLVRKRNVQRFELGPLPFEAIRTWLLKARTPAAMRDVPRGKPGLRQRGGLLGCEHDPNSCCARSRSAGFNFLCQRKLLDMLRTVLIPARCLAVSSRTSTVTVRSSPPPATAERVAFSRAIHHLNGSPSGRV